MSRHGIEPMNCETWTVNCESWTVNHEHLTVSSPPLPSPPLPWLTLPSCAYVPMLSPCPCDHSLPAISCSSIALPLPCASLSLSLSLSLSRSLCLSLSLSVSIPPSPPLSLSANREPWNMNTEPCAALPSSFPPPLCLCPHALCLSLWPSFPPISLSH